MAALLKTGLLIGLILSVGAGAFTRFVHDGAESFAPAARRWLRSGLLVGALLVIVASLGDVTLLLVGVFGVVDLATLGDFLTGSRQGISVFARVLLTLLLVALGLGWRRTGPLERIVFVTVALALLFTVSRVSHSGALGLLPMLGDLAHTVAATAWGGALLYAAWLPIWGGDRAPRGTLVRVSAVGLIGVALLVASGIYASTLHLFGMAAFVETAYGGTLALKIGLVVVILVLAAINRWFLLPATATAGAEDRTPAIDLARLMRIESLVLIGVFAVTGLLGSRVPASAAEHLDHGSGGIAGVHGHIDEFGVVPEGPIVALLANDPETALPLLVVRLQRGGEPVAGADIRTVDDAGGARALPELPGRPGLYGTPEFTVPEFGEWTLRLDIVYPDGRRVDEAFPVLPLGASLPPR